MSSIRWDSSWPELAEESERANLIGYLEERFGMGPEVFDDYLLFRRKKTWWMVRVSPFISNAATLKVSMVGLKAFTNVAKFVKPTTEMIQVFGSKASKACFNISKGELDKLLAGDTLIAETTLEDGYVILCYQENILGLGLLMKGSIYSQLPHLYAEKIPKNKGVVQPSLG
jgi:NOL1/NOP2/fmu family ribosome biogenesis protein